MASWRPATLLRLSSQLRQILLGLLGTLSIVALFPSSAFAAAPAFKPWWVQNFAATHLWSGPSNPSVDFGLVSQWSYLQVVAPQAGPRLFVYVPWTKNYAFVDANAVGPSGPPPFLALPPVAGANQTSPDATDWVGKVIAKSVTERIAPRANAAAAKLLPAGSTVHVVAWVAGDELGPDDWTWAKLDDGHYVFDAGLQAAPPTTIPAPPANHPAGKWIQVDLLRQIAVAYVGDEPVHLTVVSTGRPGWETPLGLHKIFRRYVQQDMVGSSLRVLGLNAQQLSQANYVYLHVPYVQYFDNQADALHDAYWLTANQFGTPHTHGCVGMSQAEAQWFWNWAGFGTPVVVQAK